MLYPKFWPFVVLCFPLACSSVVGDITLILEDDKKQRVSLDTTCCWINGCIFGSLLPSAGWEQTWPHARLQHFDLPGWMLIEGSDYPPATSPLIIAQTYGETDFSSAITVSLLQTLLGVLCVRRDGGGALGGAFSCLPPNLLIKSWFTAGELLSGLFSQSMALIIQLKLWGDIGNLPTPQFWK